MTIGQRVVNEAEPALGLGSVAGLEGRRIRVHFPSTGEERTYSLDAAPLRRVVLKVGQTARGRRGQQFTVESVTERDGLLVYRGAGQQLPESELADALPEGDALEHLAAAHTGQPGDYDLRREGWKLRSQLLGAMVRGLVGARVELLGHQLSVAYRVSRMARPRVLLADEVGLGKTIQAGLIFSCLDALGRAGRVLVLVPASLVHQWLAEFYRRFNVMFELWSEDADPELQRRVIVPMGLLDEEPEVLQQSWDLVIVDEAHHAVLGADPHPVLKRISERTRGLLLLTATPTRGGVESEFALLHLVDPGRYVELEAFREELSHLREVSQLAENPDPERLKQLFPEDEGLHRLAREGQPEQLVRALVDRHGTGRALIRNRRERLASLFPGRKLHPVPIQDKFAWLVEFLHQGPDKVLLICATAEQVVELQRRLRESLPVKVGVFHEGMTLLERDRQAAYFADPEGAQVLLASEIGSEGRNFQFASDLVLYDLPLHPDLIEQRIGRLDRIGQKRPVRIHVPYRKKTSEEHRFLWHRDGLDSFSGPVPGGDELLERYRDRLVATYDKPRGLKALLTKVRQDADALRREASENVDVLLDLNSFDRSLGESLAGEIAGADRELEDDSVLTPMLEHFGLSDEPIDSLGCRRIRPGEMMFVDSFPGIPDSAGVVATTHRDLALVREDLEFLSREHPIVEGGLSMLLDQAETHAFAGRWEGAPETNVVFCYLFLLEAVGPAWLELPRYLPVTVCEIQLDFRGAERADLGFQEARLERLGSEVVSDLVGRLSEALPPLSDKARKLAEERLADEKARALEDAEDRLRRELERVEELHRINPGLSEEEVTAARFRLEATLTALDRAEVRLDAVRLVLMQTAR